MDDLTKRYYTIREVAAMFTVRESQLRYYEREFPMLNPKRNHAKDRVYTPEDIALLRRIFDLVKTNGLKIEAAREVLKTQPARQSEARQLVSKLQEIRAFLEELKKRL
jgi:DNA-binding transcriptional MerR regulator